jgi:putative transposase
VPNHKKLRRLYAKKRSLGSPARRPWPLVFGLAARTEPKLTAGFVHEQRGGGRRFRIAAIVDDFTGECLVLIADTFPVCGKLVRRSDFLSAILIEATIPNSWCRWRGYLQRG